MSGTTMVPPASTVTPSPLPNASTASWAVVGTSKASSSRAGHRHSDALSNVILLRADAQPRVSARPRAEGSEAADVSQALALAVTLRPEAGFAGLYAAFHTCRSE